MTQQERTEAEIRRVDDVVEQCRRKHIDSIRVLEREVQSKQRRRDDNSVSTMRRIGLR